MLELHCLFSVTLCSYPAVQHRSFTLAAAHDGGQLLAAESRVHGCVSILILCVDVCPLRHQQGHESHVTLSHGQLQRRLIAIVADVDVTATLKAKEGRLQIHSRAKAGKTLNRASFDLKASACIFVGKNKLCQLMNSVCYCSYKISSTFWKTHYY